MEKLAGKVVWITGASSGIGEALAYAFARKGAVLVLSARREQELLRVKENCKESEFVEVLTMDLENPQELQPKVKWVIAKFGSIDILINCAGVSQRSFAIDTSAEVYRKIMEVNYFGTIQLTLAVLPYFIEQNMGQLIAMSSVAGKIGLPLRTGYTAAKHAVEGFFSALRCETWQTNVRILIVRAGAVKTHIAQSALTGDGSAFHQKDPIIENGITPEECANAIVRAVVEGKKELVIGSIRERILFVVSRFFPAIAFDLIKKLGDKD